MSAQRDVKQGHMIDAEAKI